MDNSGFILLYRKFRDNQFWKERRKFSKAEAWLDILMDVRWSDEPEDVVIGNRTIRCEYGESIKSLDTWAARWGWSKSKVKRVLDLFQKCSMIRYKTETVSTRITVCNFREYQKKRNANETQVKRKRNASETQVKPEEYSNIVTKEQMEVLRTSVRSHDENGSGQPSHDSVFLSIPLNKNGTEHLILLSHLDEYRELFPGIDVEQELRALKAWNLSNPTKRKTKSGIARHITSWLSKAQNSRAKGKAVSICDQLDAWGSDYDAQ